MNNEMKNEILTAIGCIDKKVDNMQEEIQEIKKQVAKIPEIEKQVAKIPEMEKEIAKISGIETEIAKIPSMQEEIRNISRSVAIIEHEHGEKLSALFDAFTAHTEKMEEQDKKINFCEYKLEKHDDEIYYLKTKVQAL